MPKGIEFKARKERHQVQIGYRHITRLWSAWLKAAWPQAELWTGWSEVRIPGTFVIPDGLVWGRLHGQEVLFWLEVGDDHKSRKKIKKTTGT